MRWQNVRYSLIDELEKIAEVSLLGMSPQAVLEAPQREPMPSEGLRKAQEILSRAEEIKTASVNAVTNPGMRRLTNKNKDDPNVVQQAKGLGAYTLGGAGAGRMIGELAAGPHMPVGQAAQAAAHGLKWHGTAIGAGLGAAEFARRRIMARQQQKTAGFTPGLALKAGQQTGKIGKLTVRSRGSIATQVRGSQIH